MSPSFHIVFNPLSILLFGAIYRVFHGFPEHGNFMTYESYVKSVHPATSVCLIATIKQTPCDTSHRYHR